MKYNYFKIFKFSTILKKIDRIKDSSSRIYKNIEDISRNITNIFGFIVKHIFSRIYKNIENISRNIANLFGFIVKHIFSRIYKRVKFVINDFSKIYKNIHFRIYNFSRIYRYLDFRRYNFAKIYRGVKNINYKNIIIYFFVSIIFLGILYVIMPMFFSYNKSDIEKVICKSQNIKCSIDGKIYYSFLPTPRIIIKDLIISDFLEKENILITVKQATIKLSIKNLLDKEKYDFKKMQLSNFEINLNIKSLKKYKNIFSKKINFFPTTFTKGRIIFFDEKNYVATIDDVNLDLEFMQESINTILKGKFLGDDIYINLDVKKVDKKVLTNIILKLSKMNFLTKVNFVNSEKNQDIMDGNFMAKKGKNRITGVFDYKDNELIINESNLRNSFLDGILEGKISFVPYFDYNLDLNLKSINFTRLYDSFLNLDEKSRKNLFKINNKINGKINFSADKIYSKYNLVKSIESRVKSYNGNISIEQFLVNLGKLGAADILGVVNNDKKFTNFKFESNIFVDNQKKFLSKFGIYNKQNIPPNLFISGNFDLGNIRISFYEISDDTKFTNEDIDYIEKEFNAIMLEEGYKNLFLFPKFKQFLKSTTSDKN